MSGSQNVNMLTFCPPPGEPSNDLTTLDDATLERGFSEGISP
jgi:hypothetical protein